MSQTSETPGTEAENEPGWWRIHGARFGWTAAATCVLLLAAAIAAGLDAVLHGAAQALAAAVWLPFAIALGVMALLVLPFIPLVLLGALLGESTDIGGETAGNAGSKVLGGYFGFIVRQRNPVFWGIPAGVLAGIGILALVAYVRAAPERAAAAEAANAQQRTAELLDQASASVARYYAEHGHLPEPTDGTLLESAVDGNAAHEPVVDAGGAPLAYRVVETRGASSYTLTAGDGQCVDGLLEHPKSNSALVRLGKRLLLGPEAKPVRCPR